MKKCGLWISLLFFFNFNSVSAQLLGGLGEFSPVHPFKNWKVIETKNFEIIYDAPQSELALKVAKESERATTFLTPLMGSALGEKVVIMLTDTTDIPNGLATSFPRPTVILFPIMPAADDPTSEYYDWYRELVQHELTHIHNFEPSSKVMGFLNSILGSIWKPNAFLPRWYAEGLAVEMESRLTPVGRGRSHHYAALGRALLEDKKWGLETIDRINSTQIPEWPRGARPYYFGYILMNHIGTLDTSGAASGEKIFGLLNEQYGGHMPWFINGPAQDHFGKDYDELLNGAYAARGKVYEAQLNELKKGGAKNGTRLNQSSYLVRSPRISPDGLKLAALVSEYDSESHIQIWTRPNLQTSFFAPQIYPERPLGKKITAHSAVSWKSDSQGLVFDRLETYKHYENISDLYEFNLQSGKETRLTYGFRAREPSVFPNGKIVFIFNEKSKTILAQVDSNGRNLVRLQIPPLGHRYSMPRPLVKKGESSIIYSHRDDKGHEWIEAKPLRPEAPPQSLTQAPKIGEIHMMPAAALTFKEPLEETDDGSFYYICSGQNSVMNVCQWHGGQTSLVTNLTTQSLSVEIDPWKQELIYSRLTGSGFLLEGQPLSQAKFSLPSLTAKAENYGAADEAPAGNTELSEASKDYSAFPYMWPKYWMPWVSFVPGGAIFDASTSAKDPLSFHQYFIDVGYDTRAKQPTQTVGYNNAQLPFIVNTFFANQYLYLAGLNTTEHIVLGTIQSRHFLEKDANHWTLSPGFSYKMTDYPGFLFTEIGPSLTLTYSNITAMRDFQISPESGYALSLTYNYMGPWGNTSYHAGSGEGMIYLSGRPLPKHHVVKARAAAWTSPPQQTILTGSQQGGGEYGSQLFTQTFVVRGYPYGEFIGSSLYNGSLEYRLPLSYVYEGWGTRPVFLNSLHLNFVGDVITLYGGYYDSESSGTLVSARPGVYFASTGVELKGDFQFFYGFPLMFKLGYYYGFTQKAYGGSSVYFGFGSTF